MLDELGPTFVKFGQLLSTRPDVVPPDIVAELRGLQDDASPIPFEQVRDVVEAELDLRMDRAFLEFDFAPLASASIGQVHRAVLPGRAGGRREGAAARGRRPDRGRPRASLPGGAAPARAREGARVHGSAGARRRVRALDPARARLRARGAERRGVPSNFARDEKVVVPRVIRQYSTSRILTLEFLRGTKVADLDLEATAARTSDATSRTSSRTPG